MQHCTTAFKRIAAEKLNRSRQRRAPEAEPSFGHWAIIRRHTNEARKELGLPPLTDKEWQAEKSTIEQVEKAMQHFWPAEWKCNND
jgi:hypothetical protein